MTTSSQCVLMTIVIFAATGTLAINKCSHSLNYRDLCPNPMFGSTSTVLMSQNGDMIINLTRQSHNNNTCQFFYKNDNEVISLVGIHVLEFPWSFTAAANCNNIIKFVLDRNIYMFGTHSQPVCIKESGMNVHKDQHHDVFMWHNFTLSFNNFVYEDLISNYGNSQYDLQCKHGPSSFVLMLFETFRNNKCSLIVQQYQVQTDRSQQNNCEYQKMRCGSYSCEHTNNILHELKLVCKRVLVEKENENGENHEENGVSESTKGPETINSTTNSTTTAATTVENTDIIDEPAIDWLKWGFRLFFPTVGIVFIISILHMLNVRYANELCGRLGHNEHNQCRHNSYLGSSFSIPDKEDLNI